MTAFYTYTWHASLFDTSRGFRLSMDGKRSKRGVETDTPVHIGGMCYVSGCNLHGGYNKMLSMIKCRSVLISVTTDMSPTGDLLVGSQPLPTFISWNWLTLQKSLDSLDVLSQDPQLSNKGLRPLPPTPGHWRFMSVGN